jgi:hypothetical protein
MMNITLQSMRNATADKLDVTVLHTCRIIYVVQDNVVDIATRYGLDGPQIEYQWEHSSRLALGFTQSPVQRVPDLFVGGKAAGAWL